MNHSSLASDDELRRELMPDENLVWSGRPLRGVRFRAADALLIPFTVLWAGFAVFWELGVLTSKAPAAFALFGIPFLFVGAYITIGRFLFDARLREGTLYGVTDRRVIIIISGIFSRRVQSIDLRMTSEIGFSEARAKIGTITFGASTPWSAWAKNGMAWPGMSRYAVPQFEMIENARAVYERVRAAQLGRRDSA